MENKVFDYFGLLNPLYKENRLEDILTEYIGDLRLSELLKPCLIPSYDIESGKAVFFNQVTAIKDKSRDLLVKDVIRASTAAPTYFPVKNVLNPVHHHSHTFIDGDWLRITQHYVRILRRVNLKDIPIQMIL